MGQSPRFSPKPPWLKVRAPQGERYNTLKSTLRSLDLHTVCEEARCPNIGECWGEGTATVMLLGDVCTRGCRFCAVTTGNPRGAVDVREPEHVARALSKLPLTYVVMTMVDRDDLLDGGAEHVAQTVRRLKSLRPDMLVETLLGDFGGRADPISVTCGAGPDVWAHNLEVVARLQRTVRDVRCSYDQSLSVLAKAKQFLPNGIIKSSLMLGLGEEYDEVRTAMQDLRTAGVDILTLGQYLRPTPKHLAVERFVPPEEFDALAEEGRTMGFRYVAAGPLVRSSYKAAEVFVRSERSGESLEDRVANAERAAEAMNLVSASSLVRAKNAAIP